MKLPSPSSHNFSQVPKAQIPRSSFNRSHGLKTTFDAGYIVPIYVDEALPGDTFNLRMSSFARLATPIVPIMDNMYMDTFFFAVPMRLVWDNFQKFNGEQTDPGDSTDYLIPCFANALEPGLSVGSVHDYLGLPTGVPINGNDISCLWHRAMNLIYNEWFRDQNLQDSVTVNKGDGPDLYSDYTLLKRGKRHDYFTSCLPWPQKGPAVEIPLSGYAPVYGEPLGGMGYDTTANVWQVYRDDTLTTRAGKISIAASGATPSNYIYGDSASGIVGSNSHQGLSLGTSEQYDTEGGQPPYAKLDEATAATINSLRQAFQLQKLFERDARGGTRYTEIIRAHFGVISPDARLQRPEYLGGGSTPIKITPVPQTAPTDETSPQGNLAAFGMASAVGHGFVKSFTEHTLLLGFVNVRADLSYQQGLNRMFSRRTRYDFYWPALSHIGEQAVFNKEIYYQDPSVLIGSVSANNSVFGYQERYAEYRYKPSVITGKFRSTYSSSLDVWHLSQEFSSLPVLNDEFITDNPPIDRVIATPEEPHFLFDAYFDLKCARPMPVYSVPGLIDHF